MSPLDLMQRREELLTQCPAPITIPAAEAATFPIHVTAHGTEGPKVVFVHGGVQGRLGGGPSNFDGQIALAPMGWRLLMIERPGFGQSPSRGVDDMQADALLIADQLGEGAHLIGHSWGGAGALLAAARRPSAVRSLVLIEPALQQLGMLSPRLQTDPATQASAAAFMGLMMSARSPGDYALGFARNLSGRAVAAEGGAAPNPAVAALEGDADNAAKMGCALLQARMASPDAMKAAAAAVAEAGIPVLVVSGGWSPFFDAIGEVAAALTGGRHQVVAAPNHFVQAESADAFNAAVDAFMREAEHGAVSARLPGSA